MKIEINENTKLPDIKWMSMNVYVDIDTGEILNKKTAEAEYTTIKKEKHASINKKFGTITHTKYVRRNTHRQGNLFKNN